MIPFQNQLAASICTQIGQHHLTEKDYDSAVKSYKDALAYSPTDNQVCGPQSNSLKVGNVAQLIKELALAFTKPWVQSPVT